jgi:acetolactate decarboxylase
MNSKYLAIVLVSLINFSCGKLPKTQQGFIVEYKGALKNIMHKGDLSAKVDLSKLPNTDHLFALGAMENLKGEIQIFNGQPYNTIVQNDTISFDTTYSKSATLFVSSVVKDWVTFPIPNQVKTMNELEQIIDKIAIENQIDTHEPFPFLVKGETESLDWHVIDWKDGDTEHSHQKHVESGLHGSIKNQKVELLGFYSDSHHAIFTHHTTNMHIHMKMDNGHIAGHVDDVILGEGMILLLPKIE